MDFHCILYVTTKATYILDSHHPTIRICLQIQKVIYLPSYQLPILVYFFPYCGNAGIRNLFGIAE